MSHDTQTNGHDAQDVDLDALVDGSLDDAETVRVNHLVPAPIREAAQARAEHGELSERVRELYRIVATGGVPDARSQLQMELERVRADKDQKRSEKERIEREIRDLERREQRLEERVDQTQSREDRYEGHLESITEAVRDGMAATPMHGAVKKAAEVGGVTPVQVVEDLQERNPDLPERAFTRQDRLKPHEKWRGTAEGTG